MSKGFTPDQLAITVAVLLAVFAAIITVDKFLDVIKKWKAPGDDTRKKLENDKDRLDAHDRSITDLQTSNHVLCNGVVALLDHELHNGNSKQMQDARDDIMKYLTNKI